LNVSLLLQQLLFLLWIACRVGRQLKTDAFLEPTDAGVCFVEHGLFVGLGFVQVAVLEGLGHFILGGFGKQDRRYSCFFGVALLFLYRVIQFYVVYGHCVNFLEEGFVFGLLVVNGFVLLLDDLLERFDFVELLLL